MSGIPTGIPRGRIPFDFSAPPLRRGESLPRWHGVLREMERRVIPSDKVFFRSAQISLLQAAQEQEPLFFDIKTAGEPGFLDRPMGTVAVLGVDLGPDNDGNRVITHERLIAQIFLPPGVAEGWTPSPDLKSLEVELSDAFLRGVMSIREQVDESKDAARRGDIWVFGGPSGGAVAAWRFLGVMPAEFSFTNPSSGEVVRLKVEGGIRLFLEYFLTLVTEDDREFTRQLEKAMSGGRFDFLVLDLRQGQPVILRVESVRAVPTPLALLPVGEGNKEVISIVRRLDGLLFSVGDGKRPGGGRLRSVLSRFLEL